jgi:hypothetical protein
VAERENVMSIVFQGERVRLIEGKYNRGEKVGYQLRYTDNNGIERRKMAPANCGDVVAWAKEKDQVLKQTVNDAVSDFSFKAMFQHFHDVRQKYYESLSTFDAFGRGWSERNKSTLKAALELSKPF